MDLQHSDGIATTPAMRDEFGPCAGRRRAGRHHRHPARPARPRGAAYEQVLAGISGAARTFPGYLGIEIFRPTPGHGGEYRTVYRFNSSAHLHAWLDSPERAAWLARAEPHAARPTRTQVLTGLERWFTLPAQPGGSRGPTSWPWSPGRRSSR
jgi:antibiotic biosynthesis monooxygenase (ABM) superfamily enzyme